jgi:hypothetical protein
MSPANTTLATHCDSHTVLSRAKAGVAVSACVNSISQLTVGAPRYVATELITQHFKNVLSPSYEMATRITSESVPKLEADGSNFWKWKTAMTLLAAMLDATNIFNGRNIKPKSPSYAGLIAASESIDLTDIDLTNDEDLSRMSRTAQYEKDRAAINDSINSVAHKTEEQRSQHYPCIR